MTLRSKWTLAASCTAVALGWLALVPSWHEAHDSNHAKTASPAPQPTAAEPPVVLTPTLVAPSSLPIATITDLHASTLQALASNNAGDRIDTVRDRQAVAALVNKRSISQDRRRK